jgi:hypothetical protein
MAWLDTNRPARSQFRRPRREAPSGVVVVHTAENSPDLVAFDGGAEAVANFVRTRADVGSYHDLVDSDSAIQLVAYDAEAYHDGTGSNRHSYGLSVATRADVWPLAPKAWRDGAILQAAMAAARYARWLKDTRGITIPARRINRAQSEMRRPGFLSHAERDPARRSDPGAGFPWGQFLDTFARLTSQATPKPPVEDDMFTDAHATQLKAITDALDSGRIARQVWAHDVASLPTNSGAAADYMRKIRIAAEGDDVDEAEVARLVLLGLPAEDIAAAIPAELAGQVADELAGRLTD